MRPIRTLLSTLLGLLLLTVPAALAAHVHAHQGAASVNGECSLCAMSHASAEGDIAPAPQAISLTAVLSPLPQAERAPSVLLPTGPAVRGPPAGVL
jgi:hypothetical protein